MEQTSAEDLLKAYQAMEKKKKYNAEYMKKYRQEHRDEWNKKQRERYQKLKQSFASTT
jgi:hypothetical protein